MRPEQARQQLLNLNPIRSAEDILRRALKDGSAVALAAAVHAAAKSLATADAAEPQLRQVMHQGKPACLHGKRVQQG